MSNLTFSSQFTICTPKPQLAYMISERDMERLGSDISGIIRQTDWYERLATIAWGIVPTAGFQLLAFRGMKDVPDWMWIVNWVLFLVFLVVGVLFYSFEKNRQAAVRTSVESVLESLEQLKEILVDPSSGLNESDLQILSASYSAAGASIDVTSVLRSEIREGRLSIMASNKLAGDPRAGHLKILSVKYTHRGETRTKDVKEGAILLLP